MIDQAAEAAQLGEFAQGYAPTAYYAVFHAITARVAAQVFPTADAAFLQRIRRWIGHGDIRTVSNWINQLEGTGSGLPPPHIRALLAPEDSSELRIEAETASIADGFLELLEKREQADYDHDAVFARAHTRGLVALAHQTVGIIDAVSSDGAKKFFGLIALQAQIKGR